MAKRTTVKKPQASTEIKIREVEELNITKLFNTDYRAYALYTVYNRAIPSLADGFKTVQRKAFWTANNHLKGDKTIKVAALGGYAIAESHYAHADTSINQAIVSMTQGFKQSLPYFLPDGSFGNLYAPEAGAPRYISLYKTSIFDLLFKDNDQLTQQTFEGDKVEPYFYLPIIPTILVNSTSGIAVGYASSINNRNALLLMDEVLKYIKTGKIKEDLDILPFVQGAVGKWVRRIDPKTGQGQYEHHGIYEFLNTTKVQVTGIPVGMTFDTFEANLNKMVEVEKCSDWVNRSGKGRGILYEIVFTREQMNRIKKTGTFEKDFKLVVKVEKENATVIDNDGVIKKFENESSIIKAFVDWRLPFVEIRRLNQIKEIEDRIIFNNHKLRFIKLVNAGKIKVKEFNSRKEAEIVLKTFELPLELVDIKLYSISADEIKRLEALNVVHDSEINKLKQNTAQKMYIQDLQELIKGVEKLGYIRETFETI